MPPARQPDDQTVWVALAALAAFAGALFSAFHFDDYGMLQDPVILSPGGWLRCFAWLQTRPLTWLSFWMNYQLHAREPLLWHAINIVLHMMCAVLLYRILRRLMPSVATLAAVLFAVHPIQSEPVDYVYARAIVLCTLFSLLTLRSYLDNREWPAAGWFALAMLSKEEAAALPLALALISLWRGDLRSRAFSLLTMLAIALAAGLRVIAAIHSTGMTNIGANAGISPLVYLSTQALAILRYLGLLTLPWAFSIDPQLSTGSVLLRVVAWVTVLTLIAVCARRARDVRAARWILVGLILLIPSSTIFPAADLAADRRMYLPMIAFAPAIALLLPPLRREWMLTLVCLLTLVSTWRTYVWNSDERLWSEAVEQAPLKVRPRLQLARALPADRAASLLNETKTLAPQSAEVATELARVHLETGHLAEALAEAGRALALAPRDPHALNNRGAVLLAMNQIAAARRDFAAALRIDPCLPDARENLARSGGLPPNAPACLRSD